MKKDESLVTVLNWWPAKELYFPRVFSLAGNLVDFVHFPYLKNLGKFW